ncbi:hypothetical protein [Altericista sp. CCNU0014]|uniref:hypothetical protein n=1 Tax=Altericista sp. CCNU0014 TaxID=3082949 RepID=UPI00384A9884
MILRISFGDRADRCRAIAITRSNAFHRAKAKHWPKKRAADLQGRRLKLMFATIPETEFDPDFNRFQLILPLILLALKGLRA